MRQAFDRFAARAKARLVRMPGAAACADAVRRFIVREGPFRAAGLTYFSLLAIVPVVCCMLVAAKACGLDRVARGAINDRISEMISDVEGGHPNPLAHLVTVDAAETERRRIAAEELAEKARSVSNGLFERIDRMNVGTLGWIGFALLVWTVVCSLGMVESSFNALWSVREPRPLWRRVLIYVPLGILAPLLALVVLSLPVLNLARAVVSASAGGAWMPAPVAQACLAVLDSALVRIAVPGLLSALGFAFFFRIMPHARVGVRAALVGGVFTSVALGLWLKVCTVAQIGIANMSALYGSFALLPIILGWTYVSWQIVLFGGCLVRALDAKK